MTTQLGQPLTRDEVDAAVERAHVLRSQALRDGLAAVFSRSKKPQKTEDPGDAV